MNKKTNKRKNKRKKQTTTKQTKSAITYNNHCLHHSQRCYQAVALKDQQVRSTSLARLPSQLNYATVLETAHQRQEGGRWISTQKKQRLKNRQIYLPLRHIQNSSIDDGPFLQKWSTAKSHSQFSQKSSITDVRLGCKYAAIPYMTYLYQKRATAPRRWSLGQNIKMFKIATNKNKSINKKQ